MKKRGKRQIEEGVVIRDKLSRLNMKTVTVQVERSVIHPRVHKYIRHYKRYLAHDEKNECRNGDRVQIAPGRPVSKRKRWKVVSIMEKAQ